MFWVWGSGVLGLGFWCSGFWCSGFGVLVFWVLVFWCSGVLGFLGFEFSSLKKPRVQIWGRALSNKHFFKGKNRDLEGLEILNFECSGFGVALGAVLKTL